MEKLPSEPVFRGDGQERGHYEIRNVPRGKYTVSVWHARRYQAASKMVTFAGDTPRSLDFQLSRARQAFKARRLGTNTSPLTPAAGRGGLQPSDWAYHSRRKEQAP